MYNIETLKANGWTEALWPAKDKEGNSYLASINVRRKNRTIGIMFINKKGETILFKNDGTVEPVIQFTNNNGYLYVNIDGNIDDFFNDKVKGVFPVHRIMIFTYNGLPKEYTDTVDHSDGNRINNTIDNLEWMSERDNKSKRSFGNPASRIEKYLKRKNILEFTRPKKQKLKAINDKIEQENYEDVMDEYKDYIDRYK